VRLKPRISVAKLGEYIDVAKASRRETIIRDQKFLTAYKASRYRDAFNSIRAALLSGDDVLKQLGHWEMTVAAQFASTKYQADTKACCLDAIRAFARLYSRLPLRELTTAPVQPLMLTIANVPISVFPTVTLVRQVRCAIECGALLVVFRKEAPLGRNGGRAVAEVLRRALLNASDRAVRGELCIVVDVFSGGVFTAPSHSKQLMAEIESACREIAVRWPAVAA
jgi:hypothetical protein